MEDIKTNNLFQRENYFPGAHHIELGGKDVIAVLGSQGFNIYKPREKFGGYRKEKEIDWGATADSDDSMLWDPDAESEAHGREALRGEMEHASEAMEDTWKTFMAGVGLSGPEYYYRYGAKGAVEETLLDVVPEGEDLGQVESIAKDKKKSPQVKHE